MNTMRSQTLVFGMVALGALAAIAYFLLVGQTRDSKVMIAFAAVLAIAPVAIYAALKKPMVFPFCLFIILVPFDELLGLSRFGTLTRLFAVLSGVAIAFWLVRNRRLNRPPKSLGWWAALLLWMSLTIFWALDPNLALGRIVTLAQLFVLYAAVCCMEITVNEYKLILASIAASGTAAAVYGAYFFHANLGTIMKRLALANAEGDVIDPNHFAAALILPIAVVTVAALSTRSLLLKLALVVVDIVLFIGVYESGSRGSVVAVGIVFVFLFLTMRARWQLALVGIVAAISSLLLPTSIWQRFSLAIESGGAGRTAIWHVGVTAFRHFWLAGAGVGNFPLAYDTAYLQVFSNYAHWTRGSHNLLVGSSVELGTVGLVLMLVAWAAQFLMLNEIRRDSPMYNYRIMAQAAILGLFSASMFLDIMYTKYTWV